tara:strand:- start:717 stop:890 length:174 start_codon:yes stop_codon:yes gene_type:complete
VTEVVKSQAVSPEPPVVENPVMAAESSPTVVEAGAPAPAPIKPKKKKKKKDISTFKK